jgi:heptosyltransferase-2
MAELELPRGAKVLLRLPNWLGDVVLASPALLALRRERPDLALTALVKPAALPAVEGFPGIAAVRTLSGGGAGALWRDAGRLRREGFHAALVFPKGFREALLTSLAGIPQRVGLATDRRSLLLTHPVPFTRQDWESHHTLQFAKVLEPLSIALADEVPLFPVGEEDRVAASEVMNRHGLVEGRFAALHITASKAPRAWHADRFAAVASALQERAGLRQVLVGAPSDAPTHDVFRERCPAALDLAGALSLRGTAALMGRCALFVGSDSGPMHIAAAVGAKVVAVFGPGSPSKTAPPVPAQRLRVVYAGLPCSPCRQAFFKDCKPSAAGKPPCLESVAVDQVLAACLDLLGQPAWCGSG